MASFRGDGGIESQVVFSLSPIPGIGMVAVSAADESARTAIQGPAITPALLFTFIFASLLVTARRKAFDAFRTSAGITKNNEFAPSAIAAIEESETSS